MNGANVAERDPSDPLRGRAPLVEGGLSFHEVTEAVARPIEVPHKAWWIAFLVSLSMLGVFVISVGYLFWEGIGIWGNNTPVAWGWPIVNFVFWVGIGHAGTLISAVLFLFRQKWRTSINRGAEAMTIFAVICALMFPTIHVGRVWVIYWPLPIPNQMLMWPNFRSPLLWDVFAVTTYFTVSLLFWYVGLIPDLATMRDRAKTWIRRFVYGIFSLGWRGSHRHWVNYESAYMLLAAMATPLVLSVHSIVSFDFAVSQLPGWHTTIFPPYFVAGAIFSGFGMVLTLMIPLRSWFKLDALVTVNHLENMAKIILLTGSIVGYAYGLEFFIAWYSGNPYETFVFVNRAFGDYWWAYWIMLTCNVVTPQLIWFKGVRRSAAVLFVLSIFVNIGMWFERFVIVATSLHHDFLPSSWGYFTPTPWDWATLIGSFGLFFTLFCLFLRYMPLIAISEIKGVMPQADPHYHPPHDDPDDGFSDDFGDDPRDDLDEGPSSRPTLHAAPPTEAEGRWTEEEGARESEDPDSEASADRSVSGATETTAERDARDRERASSPQEAGESTSGSKVVVNATLQADKLEAKPPDLGDEDSSPTAVTKVNFRFAPPPTDEDEAGKTEAKGDDAPAKADPAKADPSKDEPAPKDEQAPKAEASKGDESEPATDKADDDETRGKEEGDTDG